MPKAVTKEIDGAGAAAANRTLLKSKDVAHFRHWMVGGSLGWEGGGAGNAAEAMAVLAVSAPSNLEPEVAILSPSLGPGVLDHIVPTAVLNSLSRRRGLRACIADKQHTMIELLAAGGNDAGGIKHERLRGADGNSNRLLGGGLKESSLVCRYFDIAVDGNGSLVSPLACIAEPETEAPARPV